MCSSSETLTDLKFLCNLAPRENPWERLVSALKKTTPKVFLNGERGWGVQGALWTTLGDHD